MDKRSRNAKPVGRQLHLKIKLYGVLRTRPSSWILANVRNETFIGTHVA